MPALLFTSCRSESKTAPISRGDSLKIQLPAPGTVSEAEKTRISEACQLWFDTVLKNTGFNGGVLVARNGQVVFEKYRGHSKLGTKDSITNQTPFHIASVSKTITAMAVLKLWQDGKLNLDDTLTTFFPGFNYPGVTVRTLLDHRSGLPNYLYFMEDLGWDKKLYMTNQDVMDYMVNKKAEIKNIAPANARFNYCNTNYVLLALLIEKVTGSSYPDYLQQTFFEPLRMKQTFVFTPADSARIPPNYDWRGQEIPLNFLDHVYGDKNIYSTPRDLLTWDRALSSNMIFKPETLEQAYTPYSNERPGIKNYGLGWRMNVYPSGKKMIFHNGWWHGNNAVFIRLLDEDATIIVVNSRFTSAVYKAKHLVNIFANYFQADEDEEMESKTSPGGPSGIQLKHTRESKLRDQFRDVNSK